MNKYEEWIEQYKHLTGAHNQKRHGNRGGVKVSQEAISGLNSNSQIIYDGLSKSDQVKYRLAWYRELKKNGGSDADAFTKNFLAKNTAAAPAKVQPKSAVPATPVKAASPAPATAKAPKFTSVLDIQNYEKTLSRAEALDFQKQWREQMSRNARGGKQVDRIEFANEYASKPHKNLPEPPISYSNHTDRGLYAPDYSKAVKEGKYKPTQDFEIHVVTGSKPTNSYYGSARIHTSTYNKEIIKKNDIIEILPGGYFLLRGGKQPRIQVRFTDPPDSMFTRDEESRLIPIGAMSFLG